MKYKLAIQITKQFPFDNDILETLKSKLEVNFFLDIHQQLLSQVERQFEFIENI
jgi:hypothetical protein